VGEGLRAGGPIREVDLGNTHTHVLVQSPYYLEYT
jgi:hypothetical protein